jgi:hypothetical protein
MYFSTRAPSADWQSTPVQDTAEFPCSPGTNLDGLDTHRRELIEHAIKGQITERWIEDTYRQPFRWSGVRRSTARGGKRMPVGRRSE